MEKNKIVLISNYLEAREQAAECPLSILYVREKIIRQHIQLFCLLFRLIFTLVSSFFDLGPNYSAGEPLCKIADSYCL